MNRTRFRNFFLGAFVAVIALIQVIILNQYSTNGEKLTEINQKIKDIEKENNRLVQEIASASSMITVNEKALKLGFSGNPVLVSFTAPAPIAHSLDLSL